jgi:hypothetical protein
MMQHEVEQWVGEVVDVLRPRLLAQARMCHRLRLTVRPPEEVADLVGDRVTARLRTSAAAETGRADATERPEA